MSIATRLPLLARQTCHVRALTVARARPPLKSFAGRYQSTYSHSCALSKTLRPLSLAPFRIIATQAPAMSIDQRIPDDVLYPAWKPPTKGFLSLLPLRWVPYAELMRLKKTGGLYGFFFPYLIGIGFAASIAPVARRVGLARNRTGVALYVRGYGRRLVRRQR
jgi:hypothetical protein